MPQMSQNTVFVVGAGASQEAGLPTGDEFKKEISSLLDIRLAESNRLECGDDTILKALILHVRQPDGNSGNIDPYLQEARNISGALPLAISIDNFIDQHRNNKKIELCGKLAIVRSILDAEKESLLHFEMERVDSNINLNDLEKTWYISFFKLLTEDCAKDELKERFESITLIIFNYDRCIEHFLYYALQIYYKFPKPEAAELVKNINIYHPYGSVGTLPWVNPNGAVKFGSKPNPEQLLNITKQIKTFTEGIDPKLSKIGEIRKHMEVAKKLVFLGFAFHKLNMRLISPEFGAETKYRGIKCFATTFEISKSDKEVIDKQINALYPITDPSRDMIVKLKMTDSKCGQFFLEFWRSLAF
jgi:hypothetical protein